ncbi:MAG: hypothetical protein EZS28_018361 [Streblomastix strix]|uniref:Uncharacterized protein n=1 Tax=Streblomastix strix TaxID=222440 RepID=A0A5J4VU00_9EUKA|nr:MAG: hypothetical protein EZS28_018361 [Streblomastix strix]
MVAAQPQSTFVNEFLQNIKIDLLDPDQKITTPKQVPPNAVTASRALLQGLFRQIITQIDFYAEELSYEQVTQAKHPARAATDFVIQRRPPRHKILHNC